MREPLPQTWAAQNWPAKNTHRCPVWPRVRRYLARTNARLHRAAQRLYPHRRHRHHEGAHGPLDCRLHCAPSGGPHRVRRQGSAHRRVRRSRSTGRRVMPAGPRRWRLSSLRKIGWSPGLCLLPERSCCQTHNNPILAQQNLLPALGPYFMCFQFARRKSHLRRFRGLAGYQCIRLTCRAASSFVSGRNP